MACALLGLFPAVASAGLFSISPIRVDLDRQNKTDSITITNDEPERKITMQMKLYAWTQDALGNDVFTESDDLVYFPRIYSVESKGQRVVRLGLKQPAADPEKSYRLFFEEQPPAPEPGKASAQVTFVLRFGVPVFVRSENGKAMATIDTLEATSTGLAVIVRNSGNRNFQILSLAIHSAAGFDKEIIGGYVLAAGAKRIPALIPPALCKKLGTLQFTLKTDTLGTIEREFEWDASRCGKP
jgi:fimbrial chaperone protein